MFKKKTTSFIPKNKKVLTRKNFRVRRETRSSLCHMTAKQPAELVYDARHVWASRPQRNTPMYFISVLVRTVQRWLARSLVCSLRRSRASCFSTRLKHFASPLPFSLAFLFSSSISSASHNALFISPVWASVQFEEKKSVLLIVGGLVLQTCFCTIFFEMLVWWTYIYESVFVCVL